MVRDVVNKGLQHVEDVTLGHSQFVADRHDKFAFGDGGHVVFLMYEIISGRKPSDKFLENAQKVGMVLLLGLMVFVFFNDIIQEFF